MKAPTGFLVAWNTGERRSVSRAETIGLGGVFVKAILPPKMDSVVELLFDAEGQQVRTRGRVSRSLPGKGAAVMFVQMSPESRARLNRILLREMTSTGTPSEGVPAAAGYQAAASDTFDSTQFRKEVEEARQRAETGTYYQLLDVASEATTKQLKEKFYAFARKFHPDRHMGSGELEGSLKTLMSLAGEAYQTLKDEDKRRAYDQQLALKGAFRLTRGKSPTNETLDEYSARAEQNIQGHNFAGSIVWLRKCVALAPSNAKYRQLLAKSLATIPQYRNEAVREFQTAIELDPWNNDLYIHLAGLYEQSDLPRLARELYRKVLEIEPNHAAAREAFDRLAEAHSQHGT